MVACLPPDFAWPAVACDLVLPVLLLALLLLFIFASVHVTQLLLLRYLGASIAGQRQLTKGHR